MSARKLRYYKDGRNIDDIEACYQYLLDHSFERNGQLVIVPGYTVPTYERFRKSVLARHTKYRYSTEDLLPMHKLIERLLESPTE